MTNIGVLQGDLNYAPINQEHFAVSIDPTVSFSFIAGTTATYVWLPVLADVIKTEKVTVTLSGRVGQLFVSGFNADNLGIEDSGTMTGVGAAIRLRVSDKLSLMPEFHVVQWPGVDARLYTVSLGFIF